MTEQQRFLAALKQYQGVQVNKLSSVLDQVDQYCQRRGILTTDQADNVAFNERGRRLGTSQEMMLIILCDIGLDHHSEECYQLCCRYWKWKPLVLTPEMESAILADF